MKFTPINGRGLRERDAGPGHQYAGIKDYQYPKSRWRYIHLSCGHYTTPEDQELYRLWRPKRGRYYCESCHCWNKAKPPWPINRSNSDVPMF